MNEPNDFQIDKILTEFRNEERLSATLQRLGLQAPDNSNWPWALSQLGIMKIYGKPDYMELTPDGKKIKNAGGWLKYHNKQTEQRIEDDRVKALELEIKELTRKQLQLSVFQLKGWWWLLALSAVVAIIASNLEFLLRLLHIIP